MLGPTDRNSAEKAGLIHAQNVQTHLARRELARKGGVAARFVLGVPALFVGPFIISAMYWTIALIWGFYVPWMWIFLVSFVVLVPLLFRMEWRSGGSYYSDAVLSTHTASEYPRKFVTGMGDVDELINFARHPRDPAIGLVELFLRGPRQFGAVDRRQAAEVLSALAGCAHAELKSLTSGGKLGARIVVAYLAWYDWVGISEDQTRVWIESDARTILKD